MNQPEPPRNGNSLWAIATSTLAAFFGVQSEKNRQRDFAGGSFMGFIIAGVVFTLLFILTVYGVVSWVLADGK